MNMKTKHHPLRTILLSLLILLLLGLVVFCRLLLYPLADDSEH